MNNKHLMLQADAKPLGLQISELRMDFRVAMEVGLNAVKAIEARKT